MIGRYIKTIPSVLIGFNRMKDNIQTLVGNVQTLTEGR